MADIEPPSFSLGLDFDPEPSNHHQPINTTTHINSGALNPEQNELENQNRKEKLKQHDDEFEMRVSDSDLESPEYPTRTRFRRLLRGGSSSSKPISNPIGPNSTPIGPNSTFIGPISSSVDDDIEDFSDEENGRINDLLVPQHHTSCSSSKLPLSGCGVLMRQQKSSIHDRKGRQDSSCPSTSLGTDKGKAVFSDFTASPLRRFQLLDSESDPDDPSIGVHIDKEASGVGGVEILKNNKQKESNFQARFQLLDSESDPDDPSDGIRIDNKSSGIDFSKSKEQKGSNLGSHKVSLGKTVNLLHPNSQKQDLWKDFRVNEKCSVQTPAFDEICEEYFKVMKSSKPAPCSQKLCSNEQEMSMNNAKKKLHTQVSGSVVPPSHHYFFHDDLRVQRLIRSRLPYFFPLSTCADAGRESHNGSSINYMSQFGQGGAKQQADRQVSSAKSSRRRTKKTKNSNIEDTSVGAGDWINPKQTASTPTDAGRRRVHADGQSAGQWFPGENGKNVYVTKNGKRLTGRLAYIQYRKESGIGFKKSAAKKSAGKRSAAKKK
ncbi:hypothetical protein BVRB_4g088230 [Beta vulgaris subsp. vulgaris]|nr:hypothetical protein BVRB_4g088230 [Beta vulgaris subsp. vulgaris]